VARPVGQALEGLPRSGGEGGAGRRARGRLDRRGSDRLGVGAATSKAASTWWSSAGGRPRITWSGSCVRSWPRCWRRLGNGGVVSTRQTPGVSESESATERFLVASQPPSPRPKCQTAARLPSRGPGPPQLPRTPIVRNSRFLRSSLPTSMHLLRQISLICWMFLPPEPCYSGIRATDSS
jgi:hypothetical protein